MRVRCVSDYVTEQQRAAFGRRQYQGTLALGLTIGTEYLVLGLGFEADPDHLKYRTICHCPVGKWPFGWWGSVSVRDHRSARLTLLADAHAGIRWTADR